MMHKVRNIFVYMSVCMNILQNIETILMINQKLLYIQKILMYDIKIVNKYSYKLVHQ